MKIVADEQIPLLDELFSGCVLIKKPGQDIQRADLIDADVLWVRTVTQVDKHLLDHTAVRFVGSATAGYDHLDTAWLERQGIAWGYAPGANAVAVAEYVLCVLATLRTQGLLLGGSLRAGVIGVGQVGSVVAKFLEQIGFQVMVNDPPRALREPGFYSTPLAEFNNLDLLCLHPSLTRQGECPSYHLLDNQFLQRQKSGMVLLNASRGAVLDTTVLLHQSHLHLCLDVWEFEPEINLELLRAAKIATPHIAAYSAQAKRRASLLLYRQLQDFFQLSSKLNAYNLMQSPKVNLIDWERRAAAIFNPLKLTEKMQQFLLEKPEEKGQRFLTLRQEYVWRESF